MPNKTSHTMMENGKNTICADERVTNFSSCLKRERASVSPWGIVFPPKRADMVDSRLSCAPEEPRLNPHDIREYSKKKNPTKSHFQLYLLYLVFEDTSGIILKSVIMQTQTTKPHFIRSPETWLLDIKKRLHPGRRGYRCHTIPRIPIQHHFITVFTGKKTYKLIHTHTHIPFRSVTLVTAIKIFDTYDD